MKRFLTVLFVLGFLFIAAAGSLDANSIPKIGGNWSLSGTVYAIGLRGTIKGSAVATSYIDSDGYEVLTKLVRQGDIFISGRYDSSFRGIFNETFKITSKSFTLINDNGYTSEVFMESSTRITEKIKAYSEGSYVEINFVYTRGEADSSGGGGGCTAGASTPFAFLLVLPLFILAFRKCW